MAKITDRHIKAWEKFNAEVEAMRKDYGDEFAFLYEDAFTTRQVRGFKMTKTGILTWEEQEYQFSKGYVASNEREVMMDEDDAKDWLKFWRANLRRARKYMENPERLDAIQDGNAPDLEDEE